MKRSLRSTRQGDAASNDEKMPQTSEAKMSTDAAETAAPVNDDQESGLVLQGTDGPTLGVGAHVDSSHLDPNVPGLDPHSLHPSVSSPPPAHLYDDSNDDQATAAPTSANSAAAAAATAESPSRKRKRQEPVVQEPPTDRPVRVYADGIFDLFHFGHARALKQAKLMFPNTHLIVGVCDDQLTHKMKGKTVMNEKERAESLRHCRWVDEVIEHAPWVVDIPYLEAHKIDYVVHDDLPYPGQDGEDVYKEVRALGKFKASQRTEGISTSDLIMRIICEYDVYLRRNLDRGYSPQQMNISNFKANRLKMASKVGEFRNQVKGQFDDLKDSLRENSEDLIGGFLSIFGREGTLHQEWKKQQRKLQEGFSSLTRRFQHQSSSAKPSATSSEQQAMR